MWTSCFHARPLASLFSVWCCLQIFSFGIIGGCFRSSAALHQCMYLYWQLATNNWETGRFINYWYHAHKIEALNKTASHFSKASLSTEKGKTTPFRDAIEDKVEFPHMAKFEVNITCPELPRVRSYPGYLIVLGIILGDSILGESSGG